MAWSQVDHGWELGAGAGRGPCEGGRPGRLEMQGLSGRIRIWPRNLSRYGPNPHTVFSARQPRRLSHWPQLGPQTPRYLPATGQGERVAGDFGVFELHEQRDLHFARKHATYPGRDTNTATTFYRHHRFISRMRLSAHEEFKYAPNHTTPIARLMPMDASSFLPCVLLHKGVLCTTSWGPRQEPSCSARNANI